MITLKSVQNSASFECKLSHVGNCPLCEPQRQPRSDDHEHVPFPHALPYSAPFLPTRQTSPDWRPESLLVSFVVFRSFYLIRILGHIVLGLVYSNIRSLPPVQTHPHLETLRHVAYVYCLLTVTGAAYRRDPDRSSSVLIYESDCSVVRGTLLYVLPLYTLP